MRSVICRSFDTERLSVCLCPRPPLIVPLNCAPPSVLLCITHALKHSSTPVFAKGERNREVETIKVRTVHRDLHRLPSCVAFLMPAALDNQPV